MSLPDLRAVADQRSVWDRIPDAGCKGLCVEACGPIGMTEREARMLAAASAGRVQLADFTVEPEVGWLLLPDNGVCPLLIEGRCSAYTARPAVCRGFGAVDDPYLICPHGCTPAGGLMPSAAFRRLAQPEGDSP